MARFRLSEPALQDLIEIGDYLAQNSMQAAAHLINDLYKTCKLLAEYPALGRERHELTPELRSLAHGEYVIFYRIVDRDTLIARVLHGRRDIKGLFQ